MMTPELVASTAASIGFVAIIIFFLIHWSNVADRKKEQRDQEPFDYDAFNKENFGI